MKNDSKRRQFLKSLAAFPLLGTTGYHTFFPFRNSHHEQATDHSRIKVSLNAFSFDGPLKNGSMSLDDLLEFCAASGFDAVDLTGYYFTGYPAVPPDEYLYHIKRKAFRLGLDISGTGIRNDFTDPDSNNRKSHVLLIRNWIDAASKLGAPVIRIFSGTQKPREFSWDQVCDWMVENIRECVNYGEKRGVMVGIQNHNDFIQTADQALSIIKKVNSEWFGLILDIGSYRTGDSFLQITETAPYAINWQIKENMYVNGVEQETDLKRIIDIVRSSGYRGYLPIETLGTGDPKTKVPLLLKKVRKELMN